MPDKDTLFDLPRDESPFVFDEAVAAVFPDMIRRSVPGYATVIAGTGLAAGLYAQPDSHCYDLGCSVGASTLSLSRHIDKADCRIIAIDNSEEMIAHSRENAVSESSNENSTAEIEFLCADIRDVAITKASVAVLNYTLQFIPLEDRIPLLTNIYNGMNPEAVLILSEKIAFDSPQENEAQTQLHEAFKREQGYSELEISQKRAALEDVLIPETLQTHINRLSTIGFRNTHAWFRCFNFVSLLAWK